jgi:hypothetical protein
MQAQMGQSNFCKFLVDSLVMPETTVIEGKVEEDWMDAYEREREERLRMKALEAEVSAK